ncbi:MAG: DNA translocase FtsK [Pygmaiobacter massiliensis]|nr:DNA translocase FtsK [Pygmaiobacter massiliensis]
MAATKKQSRAKSGRRTKKAPQPEIGKIWSIALFGAGALVLALTFVSGAALWNFLRGQLFALFGVGTYLLGPLLWYLAVLIALGRPFKARCVQAVLALALFCALALVFSGYWPAEGQTLGKMLAALSESGKEGAGGGLFGAVLGLWLLLGCGRPAANIVLVLACAVWLMVLTRKTPVDLFCAAKSRAAAAQKRMEEYEQSAQLHKRQRQALQKEEDDQPDELDQPAQDFELPASCRKVRADGIDISLEGAPGLDAEPKDPIAPADYGGQAMPSGTDFSAPPAPGQSGFAYDLALEGDMQSVTPLSSAEPGSDVEEKIKKIVAQSPWEAPAPEQAAFASGESLSPKPAAILGETPPHPSAPQTAAQPAGTLAGEEAAVWHYPPLSLFERAQAAGRVDEAELKRNADLLVSTLASFGVETRLLDISRGPSVTRYELQPAAGVKISRITGLADDIALNLAAAGVRIEAPIPGKAAVGIEVPNKKPSAVDMYSVLSSRAFTTSKSPIIIPLGKDIAGAVQVADLTKMPHLLIAGSTGSGKSVCINAIIVSILYHCAPSNVKMVLIDPKVVELSDYNGVPHLLMPVVTEPRKAAGALGSQVAEMERRYQLFAANNVRDIKTYNRLAENDASLEKLPYIAIVIDELADLMMVSGKEVEDYICRIAQKARAAGMHLIVATQRPSVDVITGLIKANIPSRIAFAVSSQVDSRTILDSAGAEKLLGMGDMLFMPVGANKPVRIQGTYVKDEEIASIIDFVKQNTTAQYNQGMMDDMEKIASAAQGKSAGQEDAGEDTDPMLKNAIDTVIEAGMASTSLLQRRLKLGYARAARIMDAMEQLHVIGPYEGAKPRAVLITRQQYLEMFANSDTPTAPQSPAAQDQPPF